MGGLREKEASNKKDFVFIFPKSALGRGLNGEEAAAKAKS